MDRRNFFKRITAGVAAAITLPNIKLDFAKEKLTGIAKVKDIKGPQIEGNIPEYINADERIAIKQDVQIWINDVDYSRYCKSLNTQINNDIDFTAHYSKDSIMLSSGYSEIAVEMYESAIPFTEWETGGLLSLKLQIQDTVYVFTAVVLQHSISADDLNYTPILHNIIFRQVGEITISEG
jgi:hypothetical protein